MRWIGVDPGAARVGLAICDDDERLAVPLEVVPASAAFPAVRRRGRSRPTSRPTCRFEPCNTA